LHLVLEFNFFTIGVGPLNYISDFISYLGISILFNFLCQVHVDQSHAQLKTYAS